MKADSLLTTQFGSEDWFSADTTIRQRKLILCWHHNSAVKINSLLTPQFDNETDLLLTPQIRHRELIRWEQCTWWKSSTYLGYCWLRNRWWKPSRYRLRNHQCNIVSRLTLKSSAHMVYGWRINCWRNWVIVDLEIINATLVATDSEIDNGDEIISSFTPSLQPSIRLTLCFPLPIFLTLDGSRTSTNHTSLITHHQTTQISTHVHLTRFSPIHPFQHHFKSSMVLSKIHQYNL